MRTFHELKILPEGDRTKTGKTVSRRHPPGLLFSRQGITDAVPDRGRSGLLREDLP
jgi:hypothetical protein